MTSQPAVTVRPSLSNRELEYLIRSASGETKASIATALGMTYDGVGSVAKRVFDKMGAKSIAHAVHLAHVAGLMPTPLPESKRVFVSPERSVRLVEEVLAAGWPLQWLAEEAGLGRWSLTMLPKREQVEAETERKLAAAAHRLLGLNPLESGVLARAASRARTEAARWKAGAGKAA